VGYLQRVQHLPVQPGRLYAESSLYWVVWYLGAPAVLLGLAGLALAARRCLRGLVTGRDPRGVTRLWVLPTGVIAWSAAAVLWAPDTTPDQPWAGRRLVPVVLPGLVVLAVWSAAWLTARGRQLGAGRITMAAAAVCFTLALLVSPAATTFGFGPWRPTTVNTAAVRLAFTGVAFSGVNGGEDAAVGHLCASIPGHSSVLLLDSVAAREFTQVIRGRCGLPAAVVAGAPPPDVEAAVAGIQRTGRTPILLATNEQEITLYGIQPRLVLSLSTHADAHVLTQPPTSTLPVRYSLWMASLGGAELGF